MKSSFSSVLKFILFAAAGATLMWLAFRGQDWNHMKQELLGADFFYVGIVIAIGGLAHLSRAIRWVMLIEPLGYKVPVKNAFYAVMVGYLFNFAIPRMGEISKCAVVNRTDKVPLNQLIGTMIVERGLDVVMMIILMFLAVVTQSDLVYDLFHNKVWVPLSESLLKLAGNWATLAIFSIGFVSIVLILLYVFRNKISESKFAKKVKDILLGFWIGIKTVSKLKHPLQFLGHTIFIWGMYYWMAYLCMLSYAPTAHVGLFATLTVLGFSSVGTSAPVSGGFGAFHWMVAQGLVLYGIPEQNGLIYATILHTANMIIIFVLGGISLAMLYWEQRKKI